MSWISTPRVRNDSSWSRSARNSRFKVVSSKISGSGQNRMVVPVRRLGLPLRSFEVDLPRANSCSQWDPSRSTSTSSFEESAFTTDTPTPCSPPEMR